MMMEMCIFVLLLIALPGLSASDAPNINMTKWTGPMPWESDRFTVLLDPVDPKKGYIHCFYCPMNALTDSSYSRKQNLQCVNKYPQDNLTALMTQYEINNTMYAFCNVGKPPSCFKDKLPNIEDEFGQNFYWYCDIGMSLSEYSVYHSCFAVCNQTRDVHSVFYCNANLTWEQHTLINDTDCRDNSTMPLTPENSTPVAVVDTNGSTLGEVSFKTYAVIIIVVCVVLVILAVVGVLWYRRCYRRKNVKDKNGNRNNNEGGIELHNMEAAAGNAGNGGDGEQDPLMPGNGLGCNNNKDDGNLARQCGSNNSGSGSADSGVLLNGGNSRGSPATRSRDSTISKGNSNSMLSHGAFAPAAAAGDDDDDGISMIDPNTEVKRPIDVHVSSHNQNNEKSSNVDPSTLGLDNEFARNPSLQQNELRVKREKNTNVNRNNNGVVNPVKSISTKVFNNVTDVGKETGLQIQVKYQVNGSKRCSVHLDEDGTFKVVPGSKAFAVLMGRNSELLQNVNNFTLYRVHGETEYVCKDWPNHEHLKNMCIKQEFTERDIGTYRYRVKWNGQAYVGDFYIGCKRLEPLGAEARKPVVTAPVSSSNPFGQSPSLNPNSILKEQPISSSPKSSIAHLNPLSMQHDSSNASASSRPVIRGEIGQDSHPVVLQTGSALDPGSLQSSRDTGGSEGRSKRLDDDVNPAETVVEANVSNDENGPDQNVAPAQNIPGQTDRQLSGRTATSGYVSESVQFDSRDRGMRNALNCISEHSNPDFFENSTQNNLAPVKQSESHIPSEKLCTEQCLKEVRKEIQADQKGMHTNNVEYPERTEYVENENEALLGAVGGCPKTVLNETPSNFERHRSGDTKRDQSSNGSSLDPKITVNQHVVGVVNPAHHQNYISDSGLSSLHRFNSDQSGDYHGRTNISGNGPQDVVVSMSHDIAQEARFDNKMSSSTQGDNDRCPNASSGLKSLAGVGNENSIPAQASSRSIPGLRNANDNPTPAGSRSVAGPGFENDRPGVGLGNAASTGPLRTHPPQASPPSFHRDDGKKLAATNAYSFAMRQEPVGQSVSYFSPENNFDDENDPHHNTDPKVVASTQNIEDRRCDGAYETSLDDQQPGLGTQRPGTSVRSPTRLSSNALLRSEHQDYESNADNTQPGPDPLQHRPDAMEHAEELTNIGQRLDDESLNLDTGSLNDDDLACG